MLTEVRALVGQIQHEFVGAYQGSSNDPEWCKEHRMEIALMCYRRLARYSALQATSKQMVAYGHYLWVFRPVFKPHCNRLRECDLGRTYRLTGGSSSRCALLSECGQAC